MDLTSPGTPAAFPYALTDEMRTAYDIAVGDGGATFSRYGDDAEDCAWYAVAIAYVHADANGADPTDPDLLDSLMSVVVNDHDEVQYTISSYRYAIPAAVLAHLDPDLFLTEEQCDQYNETGTWSEPEEEDDDE